MHRYEEPRYAELIEEIFYGPTASFRWNELGLTEDDELRAFRRERMSAKPTLRIAARKGDELVGWCYAFADRPDALYMASSAVLRGHRRRGLYRAMAKVVVDLAREAGFHFVHSNHVCTNNPILLAKLAMGFYVRGLTLSPDMGNLLSLEYPLTEVRKRALLARSGLVPMTPTMASMITESLQGPGDV
ncbi:MAG: GNAT family N-acetyltransferase [Deltaproteobacteria bacterium]|nr:GNAT family N-acetyltransferase [Deltaproteobacteria bacterium]